MSRCAAARFLALSAWARECDFGHAFLFLPLLLGLGAAGWYTLPGIPTYALVACLTCVLCISLVAKPSIARTLALVALVLSAGMALAAFEDWRRSTMLLDSPVTSEVRGRVVSREVGTRGSLRYVLDLGATSGPTIKRAPHRITLVVRARHTPFEPGAWMTVRARLSPPSGPALPGLNDFAFDSYMRGIGAIGFAYGVPVSTPPVAMPADGPEGILATPFALAATLRQAIGERIRATVPGDAGAIAAALVTNEERAIDRDTVETLRTAGLAHVLAISGLNMVLAAGTFLVGARTLLAMIPGFAHRFPVRKIAAVGALVMVGLYGLLSGGAVSAVRAWIMISIMLIAVLFDRPSISLRNIALSALLIIAVTPSAVLSPGFQMSFAATLALVAGYERWRRRRPRDRNALIDAVPGLSFLGRFTGGLVATSLLGGISTMVYAAAHFHTVTLYGLAGNILAMPVVSLMVMPSGVAAMLAMPFGLDAPFLWLMALGIRWMVAAADLVAGWGEPLATGRLWAPGLVMIAVGGAVMCMLRTWLALGGLGLVAAGLIGLAAVPASHPTVTISEDGRLVGVRTGDVLALNRARPPSFLADQWKAALAIRTLSKPEEEKDSRKKQDPSQRRGRSTIAPAQAKALLAALLARAQQDRSRFACRPDLGCAAVTPQGWPIVTIDEPSLLGAACDAARIVVASRPLRLETCRSGALLFTSRSMRATGAVEIAAGPDGEPEVHTAFESLARNWQRHRAYDWRSARFTDEGTAAADD
ncbi:ComEC/Rec2 family competence protein [Rhizobium sp. RU20A]|uniref:ComEC/Rec2 family competence protein n=1 Tax=Rhizobium sp. RU20A TaxID=1907412 RepID=UPI00122C1A5E|nr:ComEC/Rec2 family competence protein [Rhizobium sp. RU20A]